MIYFSEGELCGEIARCYRHELPWFWHRDVLRQAEQRGFIRVKVASEDFFRMPFEEAIEVVSDKLAALLTEETNWREV